MQDIWYVIPPKGLDPQVENHWYRETDEYLTSKWYITIYTTVRPTLDIRVN